MSDAGLAHFKDCKNLTDLRLDDTQVSDVGLVHFKDCKKLTSLNLQGTQVSDVGLVHFKDCKNLKFLRLNQTAVSDAGLAHFQDCKDLTWLDLSQTRVSDAGLVHFKDCNLTQLHLDVTLVSDAGLAHFKNCKNLTHLNLSLGKMVSNVGLAHFQDYKKLMVLNLSETQVSDAGLADLASLPSVTTLNLTYTRISLQGHEQLKVAIPKGQINWSETNRNVAENVLTLGGTVEIGTPGQPERRPVKAVADLPDDFFQVRRVSLAGVTKPLGELPKQLAVLRFPKFDRLESLDLSGIGGLEYGFLATIHGLRELNLANTGLNDQALAQLPMLPTAGA